MADAIERGWPLVLPAVLVLAYGWAAWRRFRSSGEWPKHWTEPVRRWLETPTVWASVQPLLERPQSALAFLEGACGRERLARWAAEGAGLAGILLASGGFMSFLAGEPGLVVLFAVLAAAAPLLRWKDLNRKAEERRRQMRRALPELLTRLAIVVNAGENVMRAMERCSMSRENPLAAELAAALEAMNRGEPMAAALEEFGRRCGIPEAKRFASAVLINMRRGGDSFTAALQDLARTMWEQRKAEARTLGELASSRLSFPLAVIFLIVMAMVGTPTLLMMG
ncbi:MAG TPA: type II secretion system F family protein [Paenibacillaceae bacterium]